MKTRGVFLADRAKTDRFCDESCKPRTCMPLFRHTARTTNFSTATTEYGTRYG